MYRRVQLPRKCFSDLSHLYDKVSTFTNELVNRCDGACSKARTADAGNLIILASRISHTKLTNCIYFDGGAIYMNMPKQRLKVNGFDWGMVKLEVNR